MNNVFSIHFFSHRIARGLAVAGVMGALAAGSISTASAQSTSGSIFGRAPMGDSITARSDTTGTGRTVTVDSNGRYSANGLPVGTYTVTLKQDGQAMVKHINVPVIAGSGVQVDFKCGEIKCDEVAKTK